VIKAKTLGRRNCNCCGKGYNLAHVDINNGEILMPAILPQAEGICDDVRSSHSPFTFSFDKSIEYDVSDFICFNFILFFFPTTQQCGGELTQRSDDTESVVENRLHVYQQMENEIVPFFKDCGCLLNWDMKHGIADVPEKIAATDAFISNLKKM